MSSPDPHLRPAGLGERFAAVPRALHIAAGLLVFGALLYAAVAPRHYQPLLEEDQLVEWWTVALFVVAGVAWLRRGLPDRRWFDLGIALFCFIVAGEEMSWGQRILGLTPPEVFLERNLQQEMTLHNFTEPRKLFTLAMLAYGVILPLLARFKAVRHLMHRVGATAPPLTLVPWFIATMVLNQYDPKKVTAEFAEMIAGGLFLAVATLPTARRWWVPQFGALVLAVVLTEATVLFGGSHAEQRLACARVEAEAMLDELTSTGALQLDRVSLNPAGVRVRWAVERGAIDWERLERYPLVPCDAGSPRLLQSRRQFAVDPWGVPYYLGITGLRDGEAPRLVLYSWGPNRRRDGEVHAPAGDDIVFTAALPVTAVEAGAIVAEPPR